MGQYHLTVNLDKKEFLMPHKFGVGLKLLEQVGIEWSTPDALFMLLACSNGEGGGDLQDNANNMVGRWAGHRIVVIGDYAGKEELPMQLGADSIYELCHTFGVECEERKCMSDVSSHYLDISDLIIPVMMLNEPRLEIDMQSEGWRRRSLSPDNIPW